MEVTVKCLYREGKASQTSLSNSETIGRVLKQNFLVFRDGITMISINEEVIVGKVSDRGSID